MAEVQVERPKLIEGARSALHAIEVSQQVISRLQDAIDGEWQTAYSARHRLRAILKRAGVDVEASDFDVEDAARRLVNEGDDG